MVLPIYTSVKLGITSGDSPRYYLYFYRSHIVSLSGCHSRLTYLPLCSTHPESQTKTYHTTNFLLHKVGESKCLEIIGLTFNCFIFINSPLIPKAGGGTILSNVLFYQFCPKKPTGQCQSCFGSPPVSVAHLERGGHLEHPSSSTSGAAPQIGAQASLFKWTEQASPPFFLK